MEKAVGATKIDIADLLAQLKAIDTEMGRNDQFAIENNRIVATIDGQQIRINANGTFADDTIVTDAPAGTSVATKINGEKIAVAAQSLAAWSFNQPAAVQSLLPGMLAVLLWMAEQNMLNDASEGAIYELNAEALESIAGENATNPETIAQMPEVVQKAMLAMHENTSIKGAQDNSVLQAMNTAVAMIQKSKKLSVADRRSQKGTSDIPILSNDNVEQVLTAQDWASLPQAYAWRDNAFLMTLFTLNLYSRKVIIELEQGQTFAGSLYFYGKFAECMKEFRGEINGHTGAIPLRSKNGEIKYFDLGSIKKISVLKAGAAIPGTVTTVFEPIESVEAFLEKLSATRQQHGRLEEGLYFGKIMEVIGRTDPGVLQTQKTRDALADLMIEIYKNPRMKYDLFNPIKGMVEAFLKASGISLTLTDDQIAHFIGEDMFGSAVHSESAADDPRPVNTTYFTGFRDEAKFKEGFNGLLNAVLSDNLSAAQNKELPPAATAKTTAGTTKKTILTILSLALGTALTMTGCTAVPSYVEPAFVSSYISLNTSVLVLFLLLGVLIVDTSLILVNNIKDGIANDKAARLYAAKFYGALGVADPYSASKKKEKKQYSESELASLMVPVVQPSVPTGAYNAYDQLWTRDTAASPGYIPAGAFDSTGVRGPAVYYPFGGMDPYAGFALATGITDVYSMGFDDFGGGKALAAAYNKTSLDPSWFSDRAITNGTSLGQFDGFREMHEIGNDLAHSMGMHGDSLAGLGFMAMQRIQRLLGKITEVHYFDIGSDGNFQFLDAAWVN
ncbi:MAG: hypothetical protein WCG51_05895, partial [Elusimicrobiota bacterium]